MSEQTAIGRDATPVPRSAATVSTTPGPTWDRSLVEGSCENALVAWSDSLLGFLKRLEPLERVRFLAGLAREVEEFTDEAAIAVEGGVHPRHRIARFDEFVASRMPQGSCVLDLGCGDGALTVLLADRIGGLVVGLDRDGKSLRRARALAQARGVRARFIEDDLATCRVEGEFDAVVLSGVLEQVDDRVGVLRTLVEWYAPGRVFVRATAFDATWKNEFVREVESSDVSGKRCGLTRGTIEHDLGAVGYRVVEFLTRWGEYWIAGEPDGSDPVAPIRVPARSPAEPGR